MPEELKPLLEKIDALQGEINSLKEENVKLKESIQRVTDLNRELLNRQGNPAAPGKSDAEEKLQKFIEGE